LHDRILLKRIEKEESIEGGIIIPDTAKELTWWFPACARKRVKTMATMPPPTDTDTYGDLVKDGVIDPAKVTRIALQNAFIHRGVNADHRGAHCGHPDRG
jgi:Chaperonin 10 Kd subunit